MEKEHQPDSMATITMKPEYPPSEVYSTSEPPPNGDKEDFSIRAYRHRVSSSVQIARIAALTVVAASFILGAFILASSWVAARASCHQLEQLDAMLDKELALESRAYGNDALVADEPLPIANAHALHGVPPPTPVSTAATAQPSQAPTAENQLKDDALNHAESKIDEDKLQKIDDEVSKNESPNSSDDSSESDSSAEEDDEFDNRPMLKLPIQFDLDELAGAFLANNQKGRMNCVVERRHDEPMEKRFPFNILGAFAPRSARAERIAIICHGGDEPRPVNMFPEPQSQVFAFPLSGPVRLPLRPQGERAPPPPPAAEPRMPFGPMANRPMPFPLPVQSMTYKPDPPMQLPWDSSEEQIGAPREMRIHVQRVIAIPNPQNIQNMPPQPEPVARFLPPNMQPQPESPRFAPPAMPESREQSEHPNVMHQFVPQPAPTQELEQPEKVQLEGAPMSLPWGLSPDDLLAIRNAEQAAASHHRDQQLDNEMQEVKTIMNSLAAAEAEEEAAAEERRSEARGEAAQDAPAPRAPRTLLLPQDVPMDERPHYMQPRSVRSVDGLLHRGERVKRCACDCA
ncbi:WW domain-binding protein 11 isoform X2 [Plodia interpunctella]|uniref:WW domain-binding protein 11 isoform X2 n=1 Tax=Plodia interpunctella TaxID=58824 RepID=UPI0023688CFB|nr:WW domain-binding protein 11 isoform X2 [Plodia interpunctella]